MKFIFIKDFHIRLIAFLLFSLIISHQANADVNHFAGYVGISTVAPFSTVEVAGNVGIGSVNPGQALDVQGTVRALGYVNSLSLVATATPSAASSFTISGLSPGNRYKLVFTWEQNTSTAVGTFIFNSDSGTNYQSKVFYNSGGASAGEASGPTTSFWFSNSSNSSTFGQAEILFQTVPGNNDTVLVNYNTQYNDGGQEIYYVMGTYTGASSLSSITFSTSAGTVTGTAALYQLN